MRDRRRRRHLEALASSAVAAALLLFGCSPDGAQRGDPPEREPVVGPDLDAVLAEAREESRAPGMTAAVVRDGRVEWAGAAGTLRVGGRAPVTPRTPMIAASTAKTVTAAMVLQLVDEGLVRLDDPVARWLPGLPGARDVLVSDLLRHTSGIPDYLDSPRISRILDTDPRYPWTRGEVLDELRPPRFAPGDRFAYSNSNTVVLGGILEEELGSDIQPTFEDLLADPLDLPLSTWEYDAIAVDRFARPHQTRGGAVREAWRGGVVPTDTWGETWTDGGLATTAPELALMANEIVAGDLLTRGTRERMLRIGQGNSGLGVFSEDVDGRTWIGHDGLYGGFSAQHWTDPATGTTIAVMANLETAGDDDASWLGFELLAEELG